MSLPYESHRRYSNEPDVYSRAEIYYSDQAAAAKKDHKIRTWSARVESPSLLLESQHRRYSIDNSAGHGRVFQIPVKETLAALLEREDTDSNSQITIDDAGPKVLSVGTAASEGYKQTDIRGTYMLSNLLQELTLANDYGRKEIILDERRLNENPVDRLSRYIRDSFWTNLTRRIDGGNIGMVAKDPKDWTTDPRPRVYVPQGAPEQFEYYSKIAQKFPEIRLDVRWLEADLTPEYIRDLNSAPGLLAAAMEAYTDEHGEKTLRGKPFVVPGGRFNEFYGWDSYFASLGLLVHDRVDVCKSMVENFCFAIEHYGMILNANRTYYLGRSQPPFLTDMTLRVYQRIKHKPDAKEFLRLGILAAIKEYNTVWYAEPRLDPETGLSRYRSSGVGVPPETESTHFQHILQPYVEKHKLGFQEFIEAYNMRMISEPELDEYFLHDRAVRESGHDTSYRLEKVAGNLATVDLNSCLYKIECDISRTILAIFGDRLVVPKEFCTGSMKPGQVETSATWERKARSRRKAMDKYMWNEQEGMYFDYDTVKKEMTNYKSATTFWAMWAGIATTRQASMMVIKALPYFECIGGLVSGTEESRGAVGLHRPNRQWDYPYGWAPHQILAWVGLERYNFIEEAQRLAYRWVYMVTKAFVDFNGIVVEKYDVTRPRDPHRVEAEYGNQGAGFKGVPREGFAWANSSYVIGLDIMNSHMRRALGTMTTWETYRQKTDSEDYGIDQHRSDALSSDTQESNSTGMNQLRYKGDNPLQPNESSAVA